MRQLGITPLGRILIIETKAEQIRNNVLEKVSSLPWLEAHEHRQDPGENGRRIENFIGENEHLSQIIGGRPVYCQNPINGGRRGKVTSRYRAVTSRNNSPATVSVGTPSDQLRISAFVVRKLIKLLRFGRSAAPVCGGDDYSYRRACRLQVVPHTRLGPPVREHLRKPSPTLSSVDTEPLPSSR